MATASHLRESVSNLRDEVRQRRSNFYPVIANPSDLVAELRVLVTTRGDILMLCSLDESGNPHQPYLIGDWLVPHGGALMLAALQENHERWMSTDRRLGFVRTLRSGPNADTFLAAFLMCALGGNDGTA